jgi:hypothetical protein
MISENILSKLKQLFSLGNTVNSLDSEIYTLLKQRVFEEPPQGLDVLECAEASVGTRTMRELEVRNGRFVCTEVRGFTYSGIKFMTIPGGYCIGLVKAPHSREICIETLRDLLLLSCNISEEDIDKLIEATRDTINRYSETIEKLKQILVLVRMVLR